MTIRESVLRPFLCLRVLYKRLQEDRVFETASSLTYQTALALVPLFAVLLGIAKGFSFDLFLENVLLKEFQDHQAIVEHLIVFSKTILEQMKGGVIAGIGVIFLLITTTNLLTTTEEAMNRMWGISSGRSLARRIADFQSCLFLFPLLVVIGASTTLFIQTTVLEWSEGGGRVSVVIEPFVLNMLRILPLVSLWALFTLSYWLIPYVSVQKRYAVVTAAVVTLAFHILQTWYIYLQMTLTKISVIYGSFAALPLFLVWLWASWLLVLLGSELLVFLHEKGWRWQILKWKESESAYLFATLALFREIITCFQKGEIYLVGSDKNMLEVPFRSFSHIVHFLKEKGLIHRFVEGRTRIFLLPSEKGLKSGIGDLLLPLSEDVTPEVREHIERWKELLNTPLVEERPNG